MKINYIAFGIYEKKASHCAEDDSLIMGPYKSEEEALISGKKYGYHGENYYIKKIKY